MSTIGFRCKRGYKTIDECLECPSRCINITPVHILKSKMEAGYYAPKLDEFHVTSLLGCPRKTVLSVSCGDYVIPINMWKMQMGTLCHDMMEKNPPADGLTERMLSHQFTVKFDGREFICTVVGKFDLYNFEDKLLHDYKFPWGTRFIPEKKHYRQLATYFILARDSAAFDVDEMLGGQVDYVDFQTGIYYPHRSTGETFAETVKDMERDIPKMLLHIIRSREEGVLPEGIPDMGECDYCNADFKAFCPKGNDRVKDRPGMDNLQIVKASIESYRKENTPVEETED